MTRHRFNKTLFVTLLIPLCVLMLGWMDSWEEIRKESAKIQSIDARFTQSKYMKILARPLVSTGRFYFLPPDSVRWEYTSPVKSVLLMSSNGIKRYTMGGKGWAEDASGSLPSMQVVLQEIGRWSSGRFTESEHFTATLKPGREPKIILTPKDKGFSKMVSRIVITLSPSSEKAGLLKSVVILEGEGNYTRFEFSDVRVNGSIPESIFRNAQ